MDDAGPFEANHFDRLGEAYDRFLPFIQPVTEAILAGLPALADDALVLDLACGTGEPGLTLARRRPTIRLLGVDPADGMLAVARRKTATMPRARFAAMPIERMTLDDASVDAAISRFGALLFGDPPASARELARVMKPDAPFSLAVWDAVAANTFLTIAKGALADYAARETLPPFDQFDAFAAPGRREGWLRDAGFTRVEQQLLRWTYDFPDVDTAWSFIAGPGMFEPVVATLDDDRRTAARRRFGELMEPYRDRSGFRLPHACSLYRGRR